MRDVCLVMVGVLCLGVVTGVVGMLAVAVRLLWEPDPNLGGASAVQQLMKDLR